MLPSSALMMAVPAAIAGCPTIVLATPPRPDGSITPEVGGCGRCFCVCVVCTCGGRGELWSCLVAGKASSAHIVVAHSCPDTDSPSTACNACLHTYVCVRMRARAHARAPPAGAVLRQEGRRDPHSQGWRCAGGGGNGLGNSHLPQGACTRKGEGEGGGGDDAAGARFWECYAIIWAPNGAYTRLEFVELLSICPPNTAAAAVAG